MNNIEEIRKITPIGFDHGWNFCKTRHASFLSGLREITTEPALYDNVLEYGGKYYKIGTKRMEVRENKVSDDTFYLLTLAGIAMELRERGMTTARILLSAGLTLTRFGDEKGHDGRRTPGGIVCHTGWNVCGREGSGVRHPLGTVCEVL